MSSVFSQYEVVLVNLEPTVGSEIQETRPCLIVSPDEINKNIKTIIIAPIASTDKPYPTRLKLKDGSFVALEQIRCIDKSRVIKKLDSLGNAAVKKVKEILKEMLVD